MTSREKVTISGYLRDLIKHENDYGFIFAIILLFYQQGFAKYYDKGIDKDYKQKMRFGDVLRTNGTLQVLNINNELEDVGDIYTEYDSEEDENNYQHSLY